MNRRIQISESELHKIINESAYQIISEAIDEGFFDDMGEHLKDAAKWTAEHGKEAAKKAAKWSAENGKKAAKWTAEHGKEAAKKAAKWSAENGKKAAKWTAEKGWDATKWTAKKGWDATKWTGKTAYKGLNQVFGNHAVERLGELQDAVDTLTNALNNGLNVNSRRGYITICNLWKNSKQLRKAFNGDFDAYRTSIPRLESTDGIFGRQLMIVRQQNAKAIRDMSDNIMSNDINGLGSKKVNKALKVYR